MWYGDFMKSLKRVKRAAALFSVAFSMVMLAGNPAFAITPNKLLTGGLKAHAGSTTTDYLTDGYLTLKKKKKNLKNRLTQNWLLLMKVVVIQIKKKKITIKKI